MSRSSKTIILQSDETGKLTTPTNVKNMHDHFKSHNDPVVSTMQYLEKSPAIFSATLAIADARNAQNVVLVLSQLLKSVCGVKYTFDLTHSAECVMDSTHKTNASGFELYALLVPFRGQGYPVPYFV
ncbi:hypothetical protein B5M09_005824 [Aphanomyces astaci]|uniref:Uncharacterized protein n=1 Tax=Aphanomyces astaci TaxID=112090 RepID=A0A3R7WI01_APHAT|nr:hypothetical protein B5M09_005824 [Aphanomyces astaci]